MNQLFPGIYTWCVFSQKKNLDFHGWYVQQGEHAVLVDPPAVSEKDLKKIAKLGKPEAILLTNRDHLRGSEFLRKHFDAPIWIHEGDAPHLDIKADHTFTHGDILPGGFKAITLADGKTLGETAFFFEGERNGLIVGDAIIGKPAGSLCMLPAEKFKDMAKAKEGLKVLLDVRFDALLLGDGDSIISGGYTALKEFLA